MAKAFARLIATVAERELGANLEGGLVLTMPMTRLIAAGVILVGGVSGFGLASRIDTPSVPAVAAQLGVKPLPGAPALLDLGTSFTAMLEKPERLASFGLPSMTVGARVTVIRIAIDRVRIEADELDPVPRSTKGTVQLDDRGALIVPKKA
jgi:hypothetical protein